MSTITQRQVAFEAIDAERAYQEKKWPAASMGCGPSLIEWLVYIEDYVAEAKRFATRNNPAAADDFVRHTLRKISAMGVAGMEQHGVLTRETEGPRPVGAVQS